MYLLPGISEMSLVVAVHHGNVSSPMTGMASRTGKMIISSDSLSTASISPSWKGNASARSTG